MPENQLCNRLMTEYGDSIFRMCCLYLRDYHLAEDAAQETFIRAMKSYDSFLHQSNEKTWLTRIAINCCKNMTRTRWFKSVRMDAELENYAQLSTQKNPLEELLEKDSLSRAIMQLKAEDRKVIILYYYQELSVKEIALIVGKTENAVIQRISRARGRLKKMIQEAEYE